MNFRDMKRKERWSIRKLTVGAASVLLGTYFVASSQGVAKADTIKDNNVNNNTVNEQTSEKKISQPITPNTQAVVIAKNNPQNSEDNTANLQNKADLIRQNNQKIINRLTVQKNTTQKVENSTFSEIKTREAANTQPFNIAENSSKSVATNSNNSLDESTFGKVDVNSWDTETVNNGLNITGYHGSDQEHLVIPNAADFTKAGKLTNENAVITVNAAKFKKILNTIKPTTVAISKTDNKKVQVSDKTAFGGNLTTENGVSTNDPNLKQMDLTNLDTSNLTDMSGMFCGAYKVKSLGNLSGWDVSHVTNMQQMFDENTYDSPALESLDGINKWNVSNVQNILCLFRNDINLKDIDISGWDLGKATGGWTTGQVFASFTNASKTVINLNNVKLPSDFNFATSFANGQVVITNNGDLLQLDTTSKVPFKDNLTFRQYNSWVEYANPTVKTYSHSIFYDSKGSSDAKTIVQDAIDTFLHNNYANYKKITIPTDAVYLSTKPSDSATAIANGTYDIAKTETETSDTTYQVFRDDEIPMQLKYVETDTNKDLGTVTVVGNGITIVTSHSIGLNPLPITNLADWLGNDDYTKSDMSITGQKHFGFDGIAEPVNVEIHLTKKVITEQRTVTIHLYERDSNGNPVKDSNGNYVSVAPDLKATFNYQQDEFVTSKGKVVKKSNIWLWDEKAPKTYDGANSQEVNVGYVEGVDGVTPIISNVKCWKVPINKEGTSYILVPNDGNWSTVEFSTPAVDGYYANPFIDNIVNGYPLLGRPANLFVNPRFNNSVRPGTSDASDSSIAYTNQDGIYENKNEHIIWYFPKENTATIKRTINFVKNDASHTQLQETSTQDVNLNGSLVAANPNGTGKDYFTIYPAEYNDTSIVTGSPIAVINNSNKPTYSWKAKDGQTSVNTDITGYTVSAVKIGNADYSTNENDIKYAKEIAQNTATLDSPADLNISFVYAPVSLTSSYQFVDDDNKEQLIAPATSFSGQTGETVELNIKLPDNYELAKGSTLPTSYTFKPSDNEQLKIHLIHQKKVLSDDTRTIRRKVTITDPDGKVDPKSTTQSVSFSRSDTLDKVTNQHIYGKWNTKQQALPAIILPVFAGYTPSGKVDAINVTADSNNPADINISYIADKQNSSYKFVDDNKNEATVGTSHSISGTTDETIDLTKAIKDSVPTNYDLVPDQNMSYIFKASDNKPLIIHLTHHISAVTNDSNLTKTVSRTINVTKPDGTKLAPVVQRVSFLQTATKDDVTGKVTYNNDWKANGKDSFTEYDAPTVDGYTANPVKIEKLTPNVNTKDSTKNIVYEAGSQSITVRFSDKDNKDQQVGEAISINGVTGENADFSTITIPTNYVLAEGEKLPTNHKFTANDQTVYTVELRHKTEDAKIDPNAKLSQKVSRTILITKLDGSVNKIIQEHTFTRTGTKDMVTGNISYGPWSENGKYNFSDITAKAIAGYAIIGSAPEIVVTLETKDSIVNISYLANGQTNYYQFIDDDYQVGDPVINQKHNIAGKTGDSINLNITIPENYSLAKESTLPTSYTFKVSDNKPLVIHLIHQKEALSDDTRIISRKVIITDPNGKIDPKSVTQSVTFNRSDTLDKVTNQHIYGRWNTKQQILPTIALPVFAGYTPSGKVNEINVTADSHNPADINISYTADKQNSSYKFVDDNEKGADVGTSHPVSGTTDEMVDLTQSIKDLVPSNYDLVPDQKMSYTFKASDNDPLIIHLTHHISKVVNDPSLTKTVRRTILITNINGKVDKTVQEHTFTRTGKKDMVTEIIKYGPWSENGKYTFAAIPVKAIEGYAINGSVPEVVVTPETMDSIINIGYVANGQTSYYQFIDDDSQAGDPVINQKHNIAGKTGETIKLNISIPENYDLVKGNSVPTTYTFTAEDNKPIVIHLVHQISAVTDDTSLTKLVRRTILITNIDGKVDRAIQEHTFTRTGKKDMVTGNISYGLWSENGKYTFAGIPIKEIAGYAINGSAPEVVVTPETKDSTINISYLANGQTSYYQFIDDDSQAGDPVINQKHPIAGKTDETIKLNISIPENYSLIEGSVLPTSYTFESGNKPIIIHLIHQKESLPNDTKTISRKVTIIDPDGKVDSKSTTQSVTFSRNDILDKVTNKHIYGKWNEAQQTLPSIDLPSFNGYTPTGEVTAAEVTTNSGDIADINISYVPNEQTSYYEFVDDDNHESLIAPATVISGRTGETIKLNIVTPNGYALAKDVTLPRSYRFKATNNEPIIIHLVHHMSKVTNDPKLTKVITRTINVINPDGTTDSIVQTVRFVQTATKDDVTNSVSYMNDWKNVGAESFAEYNVPEIAGYTSSKTKVEKLTPKFGDQNVIVNIDYIKKSQINPVKPVKPIVTPIEKDNKEQSANKQQTVTAEPNSKPKVTQEIKQPVSKPNKTNGKILERKDRQTYKFQGQTVTMKKVVNAKEAGHINKIKAKKAALPQTGNDEAKTTAIIASGLAVDLSLIGLAGLKKKRSN
ncbi:mucin-binding protein [Lactobacillus paragasseri]|uniref:mucin-binding protein n=1 Tax=Lactobacillus paragasseri TaxID=2107999 RepID=UPI0029C538E0|nr:BspA family leucine-rich repeat surface protein [Lactobacillus paragasseri]MDX5138535.1 BspA family leucine-rich repeat surface protein [Lactobacillus paragasseri]